MSQPQIDPELLGIVHQRRHGVRVFYPMTALTVNERMQVCRYWDRRTLLTQWRGQERRSA